MDKLSVIGLKLVPPKGFESKSIEALGSLEFDVVVSRGSPADLLFYSSPKLRTTLEKHPHLIGKGIGTMEYLGHAFSKESPILHVLNYPFFNLGKEISDFKGKGFALELERKVLSAIKQRFGNVIIKPFASVSFERKKQLLSRGVKVGPTNSYSKSATEMISGINAKRKIDRKRFRLRK